MASQTKNKNTDFPPGFEVLAPYPAPHEPQNVIPTEGMPSEAQRAEAEGPA